MCKLLRNDNQKMFSKYNVLPYKSTLSQIKYAVRSTSERAITERLFLCAFIFLLYW